MRLRVALAVALLCVLGVFALEMSGSAPRLASTNHVDAREFVATIPPHGTLCQPGVLLPPEAASVQTLIATYHRPVPTLAISFVARGRTVTSGRLSAGAKQGYVTVPLHYPHGPTLAGTLCIRMDNGHRIVVGGEPFAVSPSTERVDGQPQAGSIAISFMRPGSESWWQLLPTLIGRFTYGKSAFFGDWTLPLAALLLLLVWIATIRLLAGEAA